jgi:hypothetical protein
MVSTAGATPTNPNPSSSYKLPNLALDLGVFFAGFFGGQKFSEAGRRGDLQDPLTHMDMFRLSRASNPNNDFWPAVLCGLAALALKYVGAEAGFLDFELPKMTSPFGGNTQQQAPQGP